MERQLKPLIAALRDSDAGVRWDAADALGLIGDAEAVSPLIDTLRDAHVYVRRAAATALGKLGDVRAVAPLINALSDVDVRNQALEALRTITWQDFGEDAGRWRAWWADYRRDS